MKKVIAGVVLAVAAVGGTSVGHVAAADDESTEDRKVPQFAENRRGQSYGKLSADVPIERAPDLVAVVGDDGTFGYVKDEALFADDEPDSPQEALRLQEKAPLEVIVPVYLNDGTTVVDVFTIAGAGSGPVRTTTVE